MPFDPSQPFDVEDVVTTPPAGGTGFDASKPFAVETPFDTAHQYQQDLTAGKAPIPETWEEYHQKTAPFHDLNPMVRLWNGFTGKGEPQRGPIEELNAAGNEMGQAIGGLADRVWAGTKAAGSELYNGVIAPIGAAGLAEDISPTAPASDATPSPGTNPFGVAKNALGAVASLGTGALEGIYDTSKMLGNAVIKGTGIVAEPMLAAVSPFIPDGESSKNMTAGEYRSRLAYERLKYDKGEEGIKKSIREATPMPAVADVGSNAIQFALPVGPEAFGLNLGKSLGNFAAREIPQAVADVANVGAGTARMVEKAAPLAGGVAGAVTGAKLGHTVNPWAMGAGGVAGYSTGKMVGKQYAATAGKIGGALEGVADRIAAAGPSEGIRQGFGVMGAGLQAAGTGALIGAAGAPDGSEGEGAMGGFAMGAMGAPLAMLHASYARQGADQAAAHARNIDLGENLVDPNAAVQAAHDFALENMSQADKDTLNAARGAYAGIKGVAGEPVRVTAARGNDFSDGAVAAAKANGTSTVNAAQAAVSRGYYRDGTGRVVINADAALKPGMMAEVLGHETGHVGMDALRAKDPAAAKAFEDRINSQMLAGEGLAGDGVTPAMQEFLKQYNGGKPVDWAKLSPKEQGQYLNEVYAQHFAGLDSLQNTGRYTLPPELSDKFGRAFGAVVAQYAPSLVTAPDLAKGLPGQAGAIPADPVAMNLAKRGLNDVLTQDRTTEPVVTAPAQPAAPAAPSAVPVPPLASTPVPVATVARNDALLALKKLGIKEADANARLDAAQVAGVPDDASDLLAHAMGARPRQAAPAPAAPVPAASPSPVPVPAIPATPNEQNPKAAPLANAEAAAGAAQPQAAAPAALANADVRGNAGSGVPAAPEGGSATPAVAGGNAQVAGSPSGPAWIRPGGAPASVRGGDYPQAGYTAVGDRAPARDHPLTPEAIAAREAQVEANFRPTPYKPNAKTLAANPNAVADRAAAELAQAKQEAILSDHAAGLAPGDNRVQRRVDPDTGKVTISGSHFDPTDPVHQWIINQAGLSPEAQAHLLALQEAAAKGAAVSFDHGSAPEAGRSLTNEQRRQAQAASSASERAAGGVTQEADKAFVPLGFSVSQEGNINAYGYSPDKMIGNAARVLQVMRDNGMADRLPYRDVNHPQFLKDAQGYIANQRNGYSGSGDRALNSTGDVHVPAPTPGYTPYRMDKARADFMNMVQGDQTTLGAPTNKAGALSRSGELRNFAEANLSLPGDEGVRNALANGGEVNALRGELNAKGALKVGDDMGSGKVLEPAWENVRPDLISNMKDEAGPADFSNLRAAPFRGERSAITEGGTPNRAFSGAGFLPAAEDGATHTGEAAQAKRLWEEKGTGSPYFKRWFGDSKVVDEQGNPLVVHRGDLRAEVTRIDPSKGMETPGVSFFSDNPDVSEGFRYPREYGESITEEYNPHTDEYDPIEPGALTRGYLKMERPLVLEGQDAQRATDDTAYQGQVVARAKAAGNDGIILKNVREGIDETHLGTTYGIFEPTQVKSATDNRGTFDAGNADIRFLPARSEGSGHPATMADERGFFSPLARALDRKMPNRASADQMRESVMNEGQALFLPAKVDPFFSAKELADSARDYSDWRNWYSDYRGHVDNLFGPFSDLFHKMLGVTGQAAGVKPNVMLALKAFEQYANGQPFDGRLRGEEKPGYLPDVIDNLNRVVAGYDPTGQKISQYTSSTSEGGGEGIAVDRHVARIVFGDPTIKSVSAKQTQIAQDLIREVATDLGWKPSEVQAALWAASIQMQGAEPFTYHHRLNELDASGQFTADRIRDLVRTAGERAAAGIPEAAAEGGSGRSDRGGNAAETQGAPGQEVATHFLPAKVAENRQEKLNTLESDGIPWENKNRYGLSYRPSGNASTSPESVAAAIGGAAPSVATGPAAAAFRFAAADAEARRLYGWANKNGRLIDPSLLESNSLIDAGSEHDVFLPTPDRVVKVGSFTTSSPGYGMVPALTPDGKNWTLRPALPSEYLARWTDQNKLFGDDVQFHGVIKNGQDIHPVISQPFIPGRSSHDYEVSQFMKENGFKRVGESDYYRASDNTIVSDAHSFNFRTDPTGEVNPIDVIISRPTGKLRDLMVNDPAWKPAVDVVEPPPRTTPAAEAARQREVVQADPVLADNVRRLQAGEDLEPGSVVGPNFKVPDDAGGVTHFLPPRQSMPELGAPVQRLTWDDIRRFTVFPFAMHRARVGMYHGLDPKSGLAVPLEGGWQYPYIKENIDAGVVWAFSEPKVAKQFLERAAAGDGVGLLLVQQHGGVTGNQTFLRSYLGEVDHALRTGELTQAGFEAAIRDAQSRPLGEGMQGDIRTTADLQKALAPLSFGDRAGVLRHFGRDTANRIEGMPYNDKVAHLMEDPMLRDLNYGDVFAAIRVDPSKGFMHADEVGVPAHASYPIVVFGSPMGILPPENINTLMPHLYAEKNTHMASRSVMGLPKFAVMPGEMLRPTSERAPVNVSANFLPARDPSLGVTTPSPLPSAPLANLTMPVQQRQEDRRRPALADVR